MTGKAFYRKACKTSPPGSRESSWQKEQQEPRSRESEGSLGKLLGWSTGCSGGGQVGNGERQPEESAGDRV